MQSDLDPDPSVEGSAPPGCRTSWSEPWRPLSRPSPQTPGSGSWRATRRDVFEQSLSWRPPLREHRVSLPHLYGASPLGGTLLRCVAAPTFCSGAAKLPQPDVLVLWWWPNAFSALTPPGVCSYRWRRDEVTMLKLVKFICVAHFSDRAGQSDFTP